MVSGRIRRVKISGLSTYVPPKLLTNEDLEKLVDTSNEWIIQRTGIRQRHIVEPGVAPVVEPCVPFVAGFGFDGLIGFGFNGETGCCVGLFCC